VKAVATAEIDEFIRETLVDSGAERVPARQQAEQEARDLLNQSAGAMSEADFRHLLALFNSDFGGGKPASVRFAPGFTEPMANMLVTDLEPLNSWTARIWQGSEEEALEAVGELLEKRGSLYGAGTSYPTMLMYLRDARKWAVWVPSTDKGLRNLGVEGPGRGPGNGRLADYIAFSGAAVALLDRYEIPPEELDYVLAAASRLGQTPRADHHTKRVWIFQSNPDYYDIDRALQELSEIEWTVRQHRKQVEAGDRAYIWRAGADAGIVAVGSVLTDPTESLPDPAEESLFRKGEAFPEAEPRVQIRIDQLVEPPLLAQSLASDPALADLRILKFRNATVFAVTPDQDERLQELVGAVPQARRYWWVNQGVDFEREREYGYMTAPLRDKGGGQPAHWKAVSELGIGDVVFHYFKKRVAALGTVTVAPITGTRPDEVPDTGWGEEGHFVRLDYRDLEPPIPLADIPEAWRTAERGPFRSDGAVNQGYCYPLSDGFVAKMAGRFPQLDIDVTAISTSAHGPDLSAIVTAIQAAGLRISDEVVRRYHLSLQTRGFVILAGVSGTGKTWLAEEYAKAIDAARLLVPVAPNWTTNEDLLGYLHPLDHQYRDTEFSLFLRKASEEHERAASEGRTPRTYCLILDEMNLARVEYYFAKFLSAMELRARSEEATIELAPNNKVPLPPNLLFTGTVNVDETTHGFADKVYDRAQLIELPVSREDLSQLLAGRPYHDVLLTIWDEIHEVAPFAYRVVKEIGAYVDAAAEVGVSWEQALDEQLLQKVLPKIKGTDLRLRSVLKQFIELAEDRFPLSREKAHLMLVAFNEHGFTSYF